MELIQVLHLEDVADDAELVRRALAAAGLCCEITWAQDEKGFRAALDRPEIDLVLADNALPGLDGRAALRLSQERLPDVPFILVTGSLGEEYAVDMFQLGATDFVLKDRLGRLAPAVERALREAEERRSRRLAEARVREQAALLDLALLDPQVRVIATSGLGEEDVAPPLMEGVRAFLRKPSSEERLLSTLRAVLDGP